MTVYLSAPPADGLVSARDHFNEYVKPILVAGALDWDAIEGRREGDVRAGLAERIRKLRKKRGEQSEEPIEEGLEELLEATRQRAGVREWPGPGGDIVIGRHTWKEYVRGLHEGWLGPLDAPKSAIEEESLPAILPSLESAGEATQNTPESTSTPASTNDDASPAAATPAPTPEEPEKPKEEEPKPKKKKQPPPFIPTSEYDSATLAPSCPQALGPTAVVPLPHLLGFFNFPIRIYRFLNRRKIAENVGRETAAAVLGAYRPFEAAGEVSSIDDDVQTEQQRLLAHEEPDWHKTVRKREEGDEKERTWLDDMVLDPRIADRMRRFMLESEVEERAKNLKFSDEKSWLSSRRTEKKKGAWEGLSEE